HRVKLRVALGDGGNPEMLRMIRLHANAAEYIPLALLLMALYELNSGWHMPLHIIGIVLIVARLLQTWNMWSTENAGFGRRAGQGLTWLSIAALALLNLSRVF
ncbi:MAG: MAPEG family protein, partial [Terriglobia bacterium]